jgi:hypothetical protein
MKHLADGIHKSLRAGILEVIAHYVGRHGIYIDLVHENSLPEASFFSKLVSPIESATPGFPSDK